MNKKIKIEIIKDVYWEDWGTMRKVFKKVGLVGLQAITKTENWLEFLVKVQFTSAYQMKFGMTAIRFWNRRDKMVPKFRAWDKEENLWIKVASLVFDEEGEMWYLGPVMDDFNPVYYENELGKTWEIMQSTGLKDKNGVEIFEGDIVANQYGNVGYVAYLQQEAGFVVVLKKSDYRLGHRNTGESYDVTTNHEVIGNIHSNPELLDKCNEN